jgi:hypothetical protein
MNGMRNSLSWSTLNDFNSFVTFRHVRVASAREVATVNVGAGERVSDAGVAIEIGVQQFLLFWFW